MSTINAKIKLRSDAEANWQSANPALLDGEIAISNDILHSGTDQPKFKIGNGTDAWSDLDYYPVGGAGSATWGGITGTLSDQTDLQNALNAKQNSLGYTPMNPANNLSDVSTASTAFGNIKQAATESATGVAEIATQTETNTGTDDARFVTPLKLVTYASAAFQAIDAGLTNLIARWTAATTTVASKLSFREGTNNGTNQIVLKGQNSLSSDVEVTLPPSTGTLTVGTGVSSTLAYWSDANTLDTLPTAFYPSLTEMEYVKGVTSSIQTQINGKVADAINNGTTTVAPSQNAVYDAIKIHENEWRTLLRGGTFLIATSVTASDVYWLSDQNNTTTRQNVAYNVAPAFIYITGAEYASSIGLTAKLRIKLHIASVNDVAPGRSITLGLYPCTGPTTGTTGTTAVRQYASGTVVTGSDGIVLTTPAADSFTQNQTTSSFTLPADGLYAIGASVDGAFSANSAVHIIAELQLRYE